MTPSGERNSDTLPVAVYAADELRVLRDFHMDEVEKHAAAEREHRERAQALDEALMHLDRSDSP